MQTPRILGLIGSLILLVGIFMPLVSVPVMGTISYWNFNSDGGAGKGAMAVAGIAIASLLVALLAHRNFLAVTAIAAGSVLVWDYMDLAERMRLAQEKTDAAMSALEGNPFAGAASAIAGNSHLESGLAVMAAGVLLMLCAAAWPDSKPAPAAPVK